MCIRDRYNSILKGLKLKKDILATYRKRAINARFLSLADNNKNINVGQEEWILQLPVCKIADTRLANILYNQDVRTVKDLLEIVREKVEPVSYTHLVGGIYFSTSSPAQENNSAGRIAKIVFIFFIT